jgi:hypothetical protein
VVETHIGHYPHPQVRQLLAAREALELVPAKGTRPAWPGVDDKDVLAVQHSEDEAAVAPIGGSNGQVELEQVAIGSDSSLTQRRRDAAAGGPILLHHHLAHLPIEMRRYRPGQIEQYKEPLPLSPARRPRRRGHHYGARGSISARTTSHVQRADNRVGLRIGGAKLVHLYGKVEKVNTYGSATIADSATKFLFSASLNPMLYVLPGSS